jgi:4'-phosphopantetheinyl transferase
VARWSARTVGEGDVDVWWGAVGEVSADLLAPDELAELGRRRSSDGQRAFVARRTAVREVLAGYVQIAPGELVFDRTCEACGHPSHGKPRLCGPADLSFSVTARAERWMLAVARNEMSVGVDLERVDGAAAADLHGAALSPAERDETPSSDAPSVTRLWCRKEAVLKARGVGLAGTPPDALDARRSVVDGWHVRDVDCPPGWVAAVAAAAPIRRVRRLPWPVG